MSLSLKWQCSFWGTIFLVYLPVIRIGGLSYTLSHHFGFYGLKMLIEKIMWFTVSHSGQAGGNRQKTKCHQIIEIIIPMKIEVISNQAKKKLMSYHLSNIFYRWLNLATSPIFICWYSLRSMIDNLGIDQYKL